MSIPPTPTTSSTLKVNTQELKNVHSKYEELHTDAYGASIQQPSGYGRSQSSATNAAGTIGTGISQFVAAIGNLSGAVWVVAQHYENVDAEVEHDFSKYGDKRDFDEKVR